MKNHSIYIDYHSDHSSLSKINYNRLSKKNNLNCFYKFIILIFILEPNIRSLDRFMLPLRLVKTSEERVLMKKSGKIACEAFKEVKNQINFHI